MLKICKSVWRWAIGSKPGVRHSKGEIKRWIVARYPHEIWC